MTPAVAQLDAFRWAYFKEAIPFEGIDFTGATFALQVRSYTDAPDPPLVSLANTASPAEGISVSVATVNGLPTSTVEIRINETTIEGLRFTSPRGGDLTLAYDLVITLTGLGKRRWLEGPFVVHAGVTQ